MERYVVTATLNGHTNAHIIQAEDSLQATLDAMRYIFQHANKTNSWGIGEIKMIDPTGAVIRYMEAK